MKKINVLYWVFTGLFSFMMLGSAIPDVVSAEIAVKGFATMGLPAYLVPFVGVAKVLGVFAILVPGFPKIKEWAYAGLLYDVIGATYSIAASQGIGVAAPVLLPVVLGFISYYFYNRRKTAKAKVEFLSHAAKAAA